MKTTLLSLKAFFTICLLCLVGGVNVMAQETETVDFTKQGYTDRKPVPEKYNGTNFQIAFSKGSGATAPTFYKNASDGDAIRLYKSNTISISSSTKKIKEISFAYGKGGNTDIGYESTSGSYSTESKKWTSSKPEEGVSSVTLTAPSTKNFKNYRLQQVTVTFVGGTNPETPAPTITPASKTFSESFEATISCTDAAAKIYYTLDGNTPDANSTPYTTGITIPEATTTLKAVAIKDGKASKVADAVYTFEVPTPTIDQASRDFKESFVTYITCEDTKAQIYYTTNGEVPNETNGTLYTEAGVRIPEATTTLKAVAIKNGIASEVAEAVYTFDFPYTDLIWSEDWSSFKNGDIPNNFDTTNAEYKCTGSGTKIYTSMISAGCESPELLLKGTLTINIKNLYGHTGEFEFTAHSNKNITNLISTSQDYTIIPKSNEGKAYTWTIIIPEDANSLNITIKTTSNTRLDDLSLSAKLNKLGTDKFTITPAQYGTYYTEDAFIMPEGVTGYTITEKNGESLTLNPAYPTNEVVPAKTALLLKATEKPATNQEFTYTIVNSTAAAPANNLLHGSVEATETHVEGATAYYKLAQDKEDGIGFYWANANGTAFTNGANKAYLAVKGNFSQMRGFSFESMTTGINNVVANTNNSKNAVIYDLNGRRVNSLNAAKGVYIVNGKKVIVK